MSCTASALAKTSLHGDPLGARVLAGQRALVTGAGSGIGAEIARSLATAGAKVVVNCEAGQAEALVKSIQAEGGEAVAIGADISRKTQVNAMFERMFETYGSIDILVNGAGLDRRAPLIDIALKDWEEVLRVNLTGQLLCAQTAAREFLRRGVVPELSCSAGKIICVAPVHDVATGQGHYSAAGVLVLMKTLALELAAHKVRVNGIAPGAVMTPGNRLAWDTPQKEAEVLERIPYGRLGQCGDIARAAVWLASDDSDYVTGATIYVDGGMGLCSGPQGGG